MTYKEIIEAYSCLVGIINKPETRKSLKTGSLIIYNKMKEYNALKPEFEKIKQLEKDLQGAANKAVSDINASGKSEEDKSKLIQEITDNVNADFKKLHETESSLKFQPSKITAGDAEEIQKHLAGTDLLALYKFFVEDKK